MLNFSSKLVVTYRYNTIMSSKPTYLSLEVLSDIVECVISYSSPKQSITYSHILPPKHLKNSLKM